jgi:hypothetical protein
MPGSRDLAHITTIDATESRDGGTVLSCAALTVLYHPDLSRVGEIARLPALNVPMTIALLSRIDTEFAQPGSEMRAPLGDPVLSAGRSA